MPSPLLNYGCPTTKSNQCAYDRWAFANHRIAAGAPPRHVLFRQIADVLVPGWFEWHDWTLNMIEAACTERWVAVLGCKNCVSGDTRLLLADGSEVPIGELCARGVAPVVMTLEGPKQASVPWIKGRAQLFEVQLADGSRFQATAGHRVLVPSSATPNGQWLPVGSLVPGQRILGYAASQTYVVSIHATKEDDFYDITVPGPAHYFADGAIHHNSCKTRNATGFACLAWVCDPANTSVIICSTTMKSMRKRSWGEVVSFNRALNKTLGCEFGNFVDSQTIWKYSDEEGRSDDKHAIFGMAVQEGSTEDVAANIQGIHTKHQYVLIDEAEAVQAAIWTATENLYAYPIDAGGFFLEMGAANPRSRLSRFGQFAEPKNGWNTVGIDTEHWEGKPRKDGSSVRVLRFDFLKSPNVTAPARVSQHLPTKETVEKAMAMLKSQGRENDPEHWCYDRAFPPPDGLIKTPFTETELMAHGAYNHHQFTGSDFRIIGVLDPAETGDRPILRFAAFGEIGGGKLGIEHLPHIELVIDANSTRPKKYQLVDQVKRHCAHVQYRGEAYDCRPGDFGFDCTGDSGVYQIAQEEWSPDVLPIMFSGSPSVDPVSAADQRPGSEVYQNKRVEMYFRSAGGVASGQIKGVDNDTAAELCSIQEITLKEDGAVRSKKALEEKKAYKKRCHKSPDLADAFVMINEVARIKGWAVAAVGLLAAPDRWESRFEQTQRSARQEEEREFSQSNDDQMTVWYTNPDYAEEPTVL